MNRKDGHDMLRTCLSQINSTANINDLILYKCGNKSTILEYKSDMIETKLTDNDTKDVRDKPVVVKYLPAQKIFVAWHTSIGLGNGKYRVSKRELLNFENSTTLDYREINTGERDVDKVYIFRNESGIRNFFLNVLGIREQQQEK